eukprot:14070711-Ditylum_brightwellii.AAC.1
MMSTFVIAMDNHFDLPMVFGSLCHKGIGVVETARYRGQNCPPKEFKNVSKEDASWNDFYWTVDEYKSLVGRWMDNGMVFIVSAIHKVGETIKRLRKYPQKIQQQSETC